MKEKYMAVLSRDISTSIRLFEEAEKVLPGGVSSPVRAFRAVGGHPLFIEKGEGYVGKRLYLTKAREETNTSLIEEFRKRQPEICVRGDDSNKYLVFFQISDVWPLVGDKA